MGAILLTAILAAIFTSPINCAVIGESEALLLRQYQEEVRILQERLNTRCPDYTISVRPSTNILSAVEAEKAYVGLLQKDFDNCLRSGNKPTTTPLILRTTPITSASTTTKRSPFKPSTVPIECLSAVDLNEPWRLDHSSGNHRPGGYKSSGGYACDQRKSLQWFRFSGAGGNKMLDSCPKWFSCGGRYPYWTDYDMPKDIGLPTTITAYGVVGRSCKHVNRKMEVMRCSWRTKHDLIYRYTDVYYIACSNAFCGMK